MRARQRQGRITDPFVLRRFAFRLFVAGEFPGTFEGLAQEAVPIDTAELGADERGHRFTQLAVEVSEHVAHERAPVVNRPDDLPQAASAARAPMVGEGLGDFLQCCCELRCHFLSAFLGRPGGENCLNVSACSSAVGSWISNVSGIRGARFMAAAVLPNKQAPFIGLSIGHREPKQ